MGMPTFRGTISLKRGNFGQFSGGNFPGSFFLEPVNITDSNLSGLTIILLSENYFIAASDSIVNRYIRPLIVLAKQDKVLSSAKWSH